MDIKTFFSFTWFIRKKEKQSNDFFFDNMLLYTGLLKDMLLIHMAKPFVLELVQITLNLSYQILI